jgi:hypothetical protein
MISLRQNLLGTVSALSFTVALSTPSFGTNVYLPPIGNDDSIESIAAKQMRVSKIVNDKKRGEENEPISYSLRPAVNATYVDMDTLKQNVMSHETFLFTDLFDTHKKTLFPKQIQQALSPILNSTEFSQYMLGLVDTLFNKSQQHLGQSHLRGEKVAGTSYTLALNKNGNLALYHPGLGIMIPVYGDHRYNNVNSYLPHSSVVTKVDAESQQEAAYFLSRLMNELPKAFKKGIEQRLAYQKDSREEAWDRIRGIKQKIEVPLIIQKKDPISSSSLDQTHLQKISPKIDQKPLSPVVLQKPDYKKIAEELAQKVLNMPNFFMGSKHEVSPEIMEQLRLKLQKENLLLENRDGSLAIKNLTNGLVRPLFEEDFKGIGSLIPKGQGVYSGVDLMPEIAMHYAFYHNFAQHKDAGGWAVHDNPFTRTQITPEGLLIHGGHYNFSKIIPVSSLKGNKIRLEATLRANVKDIYRMQIWDEHKATPSLWYTGEDNAPQKLIAEHEVSPKARNVYLRVVSARDTTPDSHCLISDVFYEATGLTYGHFKDFRNNKDMEGWINLDSKTIPQKTGEGVIVPGGHFNFSKVIPVSDLKGNTKIIFSATLKAHTKDKGKSIYGIQVYDGINSTPSPRIPGDGKPQKVVIEHEIAPSATQVYLRAIQANNSYDPNDFCEISEAYYQINGLTHQSIKDWIQPSLQWYKGRFNAEQYQNMISLAGDNFNFEQGFPVSSLPGNVITMSVQMKSLLPNVYGLQIWDGHTASRSLTRHSGSGELETLTVTHRVDPKSTQVWLRPVQANKADQRYTPLYQKIGEGIVKRMEGSLDALAEEVMGFRNMNPLAGLSASTILQNKDALGLIGYASKNLLDNNKFINISLRDEVRHIIHAVMRGEDIPQKLFGLGSPLARPLELINSSYKMKDMSLSSIKGNSQSVLKGQNVPQRLMLGDLSSLSGNSDFENSSPFLEGVNFSGSHLNSPLNRGNMAENLPEGSSIKNFDLSKKSLAISEPLNSPKGYVTQFMKGDLKGSFHLSQVPIVESVYISQNASSLVKQNEGQKKLTSEELSRLVSEELKVEKSFNAYKNQHLGSDSFVVSEYIDAKELSEKGIQVKADLMDRGVQVGDSLNKSNSWSLIDIQN